ncbi:VOC family protein [Chryseobacterium sp. JUb7]|uniref:VOC family protein n=1 Tax=Chryseobacterium sp. JUb7 TaxID=2940599 RepID=UPI002169A77A|nr:VOC family protein [Chryseobacterium sp. JUb7]MCS3529158.1 putative lactoylglutathione lyase [Chryseobacterium sp. JUb7]
MKTKQIWANLAVQDLERTTQFYTALGFKCNNNMNSTELTSFSFGENNFIINFFLKDVIEKNTKVSFSDLKNENEIIFSLSADSKEELDQWVEAVKNAGGEVFAEPYAIGKGYTFGFSDPDGHKFNILYWPGM